MKTIACLLLVLPLVAAQDADPDRISELIEQLDSDEFREREAATRELIKVAKSAEKLLRETLEDADSPEVRDRLHRILESLEEGGPTVNGLKIKLTADRKVLRPGDKITFTIRITNKTGNDMNLYAGWSTSGNVFGNGMALKIEEMGQRRFTVGFCGTGSGPVYLLIPAGDFVEYKTEATYSVKDGVGINKYRYHTQEVPAEGVHTVHVEHVVTDKNNQAQGMRPNVGPKNPGAPKWVGEITSNKIRIKLAE